jgi:hypothetical protein
MIDDVRNTVMHILNKENNGYISPAFFNELAKVSQLELLEEHFHDYNRAMSKMNNRMSGSGYGDIPRHIRGIIDNLTVSNTVLEYSVSRFLLPSENTLTDTYTGSGNGNYDEAVDGIWYRILNVNYNNASDIDRVNHSDIIRLNNSTLTAPSETFPVYTQSGDNIYVYPVSIASNVFMSYVRYPRDPKWTWNTLIDGEPIFNQSETDYQDFELSKEDMPKLVVKICQLAGVEIREQQVIQVINSKEVYKKQVNQ